MISVPRPNFKGPIRYRAEKLFEFAGVLRVTYSVAHQHNAVFEVSRLPCVQESVRSGEGGDVFRIGRRSFGG